MSRWEHLVACCFAVHSIHCAGLRRLRPCVTDHGWCCGDARSRWPHHLLACHLVPVSLPAALHATMFLQARPHSHMRLCTHLHCASSVCRPHAQTTGCSSWRRVTPASTPGWQWRCTHCGMLPPPPCCRPYLYYRKDIFQRYSLSVPQTWEEFVSLALRMNSTDFNNDGAPGDAPHSAPSRALACTAQHLPRRVAVMWQGRTHMRIVLPVWDCPAGRNGGGGAFRVPVDQPVLTQAMRVAWPPACRDS